MLVQMAMPFTLDTLIKEGCQILTVCLIIQDNQWLPILQLSTVTKVLSLANIYDKGHLGFLDGFPAWPHPLIRIKLP